MNVSIIIPTYQGGRLLPQLLARLKDQTVLPMEIIVIDSSSTDDTVEIAEREGCQVRRIDKAEFNHGGTRNLGAHLAKGDILVFMTQDALPANERYVEELTRSLSTGSAAAAFARQVPYDDAPPPERFARAFNYPPHSTIRNAGDIPRLGVKAFFFSNVASAVTRERFWSVGGFPDNVILNEDMLLCAKILRAGYAVAYEASAVVYHSHSYSVRQQFGRYFDIGVAMAQAGPTLAEAKAGGEGVRFTIQLLKHLVSNRHVFWIPHVILETGAKLIAFSLGRREQYLPLWLKRRLSMHSFYWV